MIEKPELQEKQLVACLEREYGFKLASLSFLPLGADVNTVVYRAVSVAGKAFFVKLRKYAFNPASIKIPAYLHALGHPYLISPLATTANHLWTKFEDYYLIVFPFVNGQDGFAAQMGKTHWLLFGKYLKGFHTTKFPPEIIEGIKHETFTSPWRKKLRTHLEKLSQTRPQDPLATELTLFLLEKRAETFALLEETQRYANLLKEQALDFILCHADIHLWNLFIEEQGQLFFVDWDTLLFAPKERDLMFVGAGLGSSGYAPQAEENMFYQGYGVSENNIMALTYFRFERIIEDLAIYCDQIFFSTEGGQDRLEALVYLKSNFRQQGPLATARHAAVSLDK